MADTRPYKRRKLVVDAKLQVGLVLNLVARLYGYFVLFVVLANAPSLWTLATEPSGGAEHVAATAQLKWFATQAVLPLALTFVAVAVHGVILMHRVAGPLYRFKQVLRTMAQLDFASDVHIRHKDYLRDVETEFNRTLGSLRGEVARLRRMNGETREAVEALVAAAEQGDVARADALAGAHAALDCVERLERHLDRADGEDEGEERVLRVPPPEAVNPEPAPESGAEPAARPADQLQTA